MLGPFELTEADWGSALDAVIDPDDTVLECDESNNLTALGAWPCEAP